MGQETVKKKLSELARKGAEQCARFRRLRSHLDPVQPRLGQTKGVQVNPKKQKAISKNTNAGGTTEIAMLTKMFSARKLE